jgi:hypothetical protein
MHGQQVTQRTKSSSRFEAFPCIYIKGVAGFGSKIEFKFVDHAKDKPLDSKFTIVFKEPYVDGVLRPECRQLLLQFAINESIQSCRYTILAFAENDKIYVEPDGRTDSAGWTGRNRAFAVDRQRREFEQIFKTWVRTPTLNEVEPAWILPLFIDRNITAAIEEGLKRWSEQKLKVKEYRDLFQLAINCGVLVELPPRYQKFALRLIELQSCNVGAGCN